MAEGIEYEIKSHGMGMYLHSRVSVVSDSLIYLGVSDAQVGKNMGELKIAYDNLVEATQSIQPGRNVRGFLELNLCVEDEVKK